jgi:hypothetical protein
MRRATADRTDLPPRPGPANRRGTGDDPVAQAARRYRDLRAAGTDAHYAGLGALDAYLAAADPSVDLDAAQEAVVALCASEERARERGEDTAAAGPARTVRLH